MTLSNAHKQVLDQLKTGVLLLDKDLRPLYLNLAAESLFEISGKQAPKLVLENVLLGAAEDIKEIKQALKTQISYTKHKVKFNLITGKHITVDYSISPFEEDGEINILMEVNSLYYSQRISRDEAIFSTQATTRELVRGLAHEIKNPLGGIRGAAQLLAQELPDTELSDYTNVIIEEADRLRNLVDRLVGAKKLPDMQLVNIHEVLERVTALVEVEFADKNIELVKDYDPSIPALMGDSEQLIQATLNVVRNAVQALDSPDIDHDLGKIVLRTRVARHETIGTTIHRLAVQINVEDNGPGIPSQLKDSLFYPMISGRADGSGLGLSIAQSIANQHGGIIECDSEAGKTVFSITIPLHDGSGSTR